ncbi:MAG: tetratricopeptide repeat protein [Vicinamibacterales bacterium]
MIKVVQRRRAFVVSVIAVALSSLVGPVYGHGPAPDPQAAATPPVVVEPGMDAVVRAFFTTQEAEDVAGYLALWSRTASRPSPAMLKFVFDSGDDRYSDISILRVDLTGAVTRVRVAATRDRTAVTPAGPGPSTHSRYIASLLMVREDGEWRLVGEAPAADDLATDLLAATSPEARETLLRESPALVNRQLVEAISRRSTDLIRDRDYAAAQTVFERALDIAQRIGDRKVEGETLQNLANAFYFQRNFPRALEGYEQRLAIERERHDPEAIATSLVSVGNVRYALAEYAVALTHYREALALQEPLPDQSAAASTLISTGNVSYLLGDYPLAIADYRRSRDAHRALGLGAGESMALAGLGRVYVAQGNYAAAIEAFSGVLAEGKSRNDRRAQGGAQMSLGDVHIRLGNLTAARSALAESRGHFEGTRDGANLGRAWQALALVDLIGGEFAAAERGYSRSGEICRTAADDECAASAAVGLGFAQATQGRFDDAAASYTRAVGAFTALDRPEQAARAQIGLAQAQTGLARYDEALASAAGARHTAISLSLNDVLWRAQIAEAEAHRKSGAPHRALGAARAALYAVDELREATRSQPGSPLPRDTTAAFATLVRLQADSGDAAGAFDTSERLRVHDLRAALAGNEREIARGMTAEERDAERTAAAEVISIRAQIARERGLPRPDAARLEGFERLLTAAVSARATGQEQLFTRLPELAGWRGMFAPSASADVAQVLGPGEVLLDFVIDDDALVGLAAWVDDGKVVVVAGPPRSGGARLARRSRGCCCPPR